MIRHIARQCIIALACASVVVSAQQAPELANKLTAAVGSENTARLRNEIANLGEMGITELIEKRSDSLRLVLEYERLDSSVRDSRLDGQALTDAKLRLDNEVDPFLSASREVMDLATSVAPMLSRMTPILTDVAPAIHADLLRTVSKEEQDLLRSYGVTGDQYERIIGDSEVGIRTVSTASIQDRSKRLTKEELDTKTTDPPWRDGFIRAIGKMALGLALVAGDVPLIKVVWPVASLSVVGGGKIFWNGVEWIVDN